MPFKGIFTQTLSGILNRYLWCYNDVTSQIGTLDTYFEIQVPGTSMKSMLIQNYSIDLWYQEHETKYFLNK